MQDWLERISPRIHVVGSAETDLQWAEPKRVLYDHELVLFGSGKHIVEIRKVEYDCPAGHFIIIPPGQTEKSWLLPGAPGHRHWVHFDWAWQPRFRGVPTMTYSTLPLKKEWVRPAPRFVPARILRGKMRRPERAFVLHDELEKRWSSGDAKEQLCCRGVLLELLCELLAEPRGPSFAEVRTHDLVARARRRLREMADAPLNECPPIRVELATLGYSYGHVLKRFKAHCGITPIEYLTALRIERAQRLLRETDLTVTEIGYQLGIDNPAYFTRLFKQNVGVSPKAYRREGQRPG